MTTTARAEDLASTAARELAQRHAGVVVGVLTGPDDQAVFGGAGVVGAVRAEDDGGRTGRPVRSRVSPDEHTIFDIGSITKVFTSLVLADLVVAGRLSLDTPVESLLPSGSRVPRRDGVAITVRHLATHSSGLPRSPGRWRDEAFSKDPYSRLSEADVLDAVAGLRLRRTSGTGGVHYSNVGVALLGIALRQVTGAATFDVMVQAHVAEPLGLPDTRSVLQEHQRARMATGHRWRRSAVVPWQLDGMAGAGALRSTAVDMTTFLRAQLHPGSGPLGPAIALTQREHGAGRDAGDDGRHGIGLGWMRMQARPPRGGRPTLLLWHNGGTNGYRSIAALAPADGTAVVVLTSSFTLRGPDGVAMRLLQDLAPPR
jgi:CubicO group peptidase (beta-lactamase class C family)